MISTPPFPIILASASPRRKELLQRIFSDFLIIPADIDETVAEDIPPTEVPQYLAKKKAEYLARTRHDAMIIAADTIVLHQDEILGKPKDEEDAFRMLKLLSGKTHRVITGCCVIYQNKTILFSEESKVSFFDLTDDEILSYIKTKEPFGKAGAYAIQGLGGLFIKGITGDYYNIVGLPLGSLYQSIKQLLEGNQINDY